MTRTDAAAVGTGVDADAGKAEDPAAVEEADGSAFEYTLGRHISKRKSKRCANQKSLRKRVVHLGI